MCGIVGLISKRQNGFYARDLDNFQAMLVNDTQRGEDSTGAFGVSRNGDVDSVKVASNPFNLFRCDEWRKFRASSLSTGRILVGHNRKATQGSINSANAHPFVEGNVILVHNGTLRNHTSLKTGKEVDSHGVAHLFNADGFEETIPKINGAFAFVWYNIETEKLYMIRNDERPLAIVETEENIMFASEAWMAQGQCHRNSDKILTSHMLPAGVLHEFSISGKMTTRTIELYKEPPVVHTYQGTYTGRKHHSEYWSEMYGDDVDDVANAPTVLDRPTNVNKNVFEKNDIIQVVLTSVKKEDNVTTGMPGWKGYGHVMEIEKPSYDIVGWMPNELNGEQCALWLNQPLLCNISHVVGSNCGPSVWVTYFALDEVLQTHGGPVGEWTYERICEQHVCDQCHAKIELQDYAFTSVNVKRNNVRVNCHKCVINALPLGDVRNALVQRRNAAVQAREQLSQTVVPKTNVLVLPSGKASVH